jgi:hypothetical protein
MSADYWFPKFVMSGLLLIMGRSFFDWEHPASIIGCAIPVSMALMMSSLTRVKPEAEELMYRRFFQWKPIDYSEIVECNAFWALGFVRAKQYVFPWGGIYFVLPRDRQHDYRWDRNIVSFIRDKAGISPLG